MATAPRTPELFQTQMFQSKCQYKGTHAFSERFMVIDARLKILRIYKNEQELRSKDNGSNKKKFKEIELNKAQISPVLHIVNDKQNCVEIIVDYPRYLHFENESHAKTALEFLQGTVAVNVKQTGIKSKFSALSLFCFVLYMTKQYNFDDRPIDYQHFKFQCVHLLENKLQDFMMVIDIKKGFLYLCSLKDALSVLHIKLKHSQIIHIQKDTIAMKIIQHELVKGKPNLSVFVNDVCYTFWFYHENAKQSALMCIQRVQKSPKKKKKLCAEKLVSYFTFIFYVHILCSCCNC